MNWMDDFLTRCLEGVPEGAYRNRTETELRDHLETLARDLEEAGYAPEKARTLAQSRMGDPSKLAWKYMQEWKRRSWRRWPIIAEMLLFNLSVCWVGQLYIANARNFGRDVVSGWAIAAHIAVMVLTVETYRILNGERKTLARLSCLTLVVFQLPPILGWTLTAATGGAFEFSGVMVPGWAGVLVHGLFFLWGAVNYWAITNILKENGPKWSEVG